MTSLMESFEEWARRRHYQHTDYDQMVASQCNAADNCVMDPACPFIATCTEAQSRAPAAQPVNLQTAPTAKETAMPNLSGIASDIENAIGNADQWVKEVTETHLPGLLAIAQKYENSPIVQALETVLLPPSVEQGIAATIAEFAKLYPAPAADAQPVTAAPAA